MTEDKSAISVWFFTGALMAFYGLVITGYGLATLGQPPSARPLANLRPDIWWGALMLVVGMIYTVKFWPGKKH